MNNKVISAIKSSIITLLRNKIILFPYIIIAFIQLLLLEILFFSPRYPLNIFFGPIIKKLWSGVYLHYPLNFVLLPKLFNNMQIPIYILISTYLIAVSINLLVVVNNGSKFTLSSIFRKTFGSYVHIIMATIIAVFISLAFVKGYNLILNRALLIKSEVGIYSIIKKVIIYGAPYFNLLLNILGTTLIAYLIPIIVIDKKNVFKALFLNFKVLLHSFWFTFFVVLIPSLLYLIVLWIKSSITVQMQIPELGVLIMIFSIFIIITIDAVVYTALSTHYLLTKEKS